MSGREGEACHGEGIVDLGMINFEVLQAHFERGQKRTKAEKLRGRVNANLGWMVRLNKGRADYLEKMGRLIEECNSGSMNVEASFWALLRLAEELDEEERRGISEGFSEEELAVFDILTKPEISIIEKERAHVKEVACELLETLKREKLVHDWRKRQRSLAEVRIAIEETLDGLPEAYTNTVRTKV